MAFLPVPCFFPDRAGKTSLIFAFRQPFLGWDGLKYVAKTGAVQRPLVVVWSGVILPYSGKQGTILVYSPQEQKRTRYRGFPVRAKTHPGESEPVQGSFLHIGMTPS